MIDDIPVAIKRLTWCGDSRTRCTPPIWLTRGTLSRNVYEGGRVGSGKLVLAKGSRSSRYCMRHTSVAMFGRRISPFELAAGHVVITSDLSVTVFLRGVRWSRSKKKSPATLNVWLTLIGLISLRPLSRLHKGSSNGTWNVLVKLFKCLSVPRQVGRALPRTPKLFLVQFYWHLQRVIHSRLAGDGSMVRCADNGGGGGSSFDPRQRGALLCDIIEIVTQSHHWINTAGWQSSPGPSPTCSVLQVVYGTSVMGAACT